MVRTKRLHLICLAALVLAVAGCGPEKARTVEEMAAALRANGVPYDVSETAALASVRGEGMRLTGRHLAVEIYRVDDQAEMQLASTEAQAAPASEGPAPAASPPRCYVKPPFLFVVRREPAGGEVAAALNRILGG